MVNREGLCAVEARLSDISYRAEKRVTKDGVQPLRLDSADRGPFKYELLSPPSRRRVRCSARTLRAASRLVSMPRLSIKLKRSSPPEAPR